MATYRHGKKKYYKKYRKSGKKSDRKAYKKFKKRVKRVIFSTCEKYKMVFTTGDYTLATPTANWFSSATVVTNQVKWMCLPALVSQGIGGTDYILIQNYLLSSNTLANRFQTANPSIQMIKGKEFYMGTVDIRIKFMLQLVSTNSDTQQITLQTGFEGTDSMNAPCAVFMVIQAAKGMTDTLLENHLANAQYPFMAPTNSSYVKVLKRTDFRLTAANPQYAIHWKFNKKPKRYQLGNLNDTLPEYTYAQNGKIYMYYACYNCTINSIANVAAVINPVGYIRCNLYDNN